MPPPLWLLRIYSSLHVFLYKLSSGRLGATTNGMPVLLLTTSGRRTGQSHTVPLVYMRDGTDYVVAPGVLERPAWYLNLRTNFWATIQNGPSLMPVEARQARGDERRRLWARVPPYWHDYQSSHRGEMPLMILKAVDPYGSVAAGDIA